MTRQKAPVGAALLIAAGLLVAGSLDVSAWTREECPTRDTHPDIHQYFPEPTATVATHATATLAATAGVPSGPTRSIPIGSGDCTDNCVKETDLATRRALTATATPVRPSPTVPATVVAVVPEPTRASLPTATSVVTRAAEPTPAPVVSVAPPTWTALPTAVPQLPTVTPLPTKAGSNQPPITGYTGKGKD